MNFQHSGFFMLILGLFEFESESQSESESDKLVAMITVGSRHSPLGLQIYFSIISENADALTTCTGRGTWAGGEDGMGVKWASHYY